MLVLCGIQVGYGGMHRRVPGWSGEEPTWQEWRKLASPQRLGVESQSPRSHQSPALPLTSGSWAAHAFPCIAFIWHILGATFVSAPCNPGLLPCHFRRGMEAAPFCASSCSTFILPHSPSRDPDEIRQISSLWLGYAFLPPPPHLYNPTGSNTPAIGKSLISLWNHGAQHCDKVRQS